MDDLHRMKKSELDRSMATYLAMVVRNEMEDFHCVNLSDKQMAELNPIIRNAIYTGLAMARAAQKGSPVAKTFVAFQAKMIPEYWEPPEFTDEKFYAQKKR
jgi:hypothetical protein